SPPRPHMPLMPVGRTAAAFQAEESPGSIRMRRRITSGGGDPRESATESKPPEARRKARQGKGERVRQERTASAATSAARQAPPGAKPNRSDAGRLQRLGASPPAWSLGLV